MKTKPPTERRHLQPMIPTKNYYQNYIKSSYKLRKYNPLKIKATFFRNFIKEINVLWTHEKKSRVISYQELFHMTELVQIKMSEAMKCRGQCHMQSLLNASSFVPRKLMHVDNIDEFS